MFFLCSLPHTLVDEKKRRKETEELGTGERKVIITVKKKKNSLPTVQGRKKEYFFSFPPLR